MQFSNLLLEGVKKYHEKQSSFSLEECKTNLYCGYEFLPPDIPYIVCLLSHGQQQYV